MRNNKFNKLQKTVTMSEEESVITWEYIVGITIFAAVIGIVVLCFCLTGVDCIVYQDALEAMMVIKLEYFVPGEGNAIVTFLKMALMQVIKQ